MMTRYQARRLVALFVTLVGATVIIVQSPEFWQETSPAPPEQSNVQANGEVVAELQKLPVKGRAPKTGYSRQQFGDGWNIRPDGCSTREIILARDLKSPTYLAGCRVASGTLLDPYSGKTVQFQRGPATSAKVQIDHVVALSDAWQKGAQALPFLRREQFANDSLNLLAVDGAANQQKSDGDAATWLPPNKLFRCQYVARQVAVKQKYLLWLTSAEKEAMTRVLASCPQEKLPMR